MEYTKLFSNQCIYIRHQEHNIVLTSVQINDITLLGSDIDAIKRSKTDLGKHFTITDLGEAKQVVGLELEGTWRKESSSYHKHNISKEPWKIWHGGLSPSQHTFGPKCQINQATRNGTL